jgi:hypothetical protein
MNLHIASWIECNSMEFEFKHIDWNSNFVELNQAQYSFSLDSIRLMFPLNFNWIEFSWIESYWIWLNTDWLNSTKLWKFNYKRKC